MGFKRLFSIIHTNHTLNLLLIYLFIAYTFLNAYLRPSYMLQPSFKYDPSNVVLFISFTWHIFPHLMMWGSRSVFTVAFGLFNADFTFMLLSRVSELGCRHSNECPPEKSCINGVCDNPCRSGNPCDAEEECEVQNHEAVCVKREHATPNFS